MAHIGSFALLLALALSLYSFGAGLLALFFPGRPGLGACRRNRPPRRRRRFRMRPSRRASPSSSPPSATISPSPTSSTTATATFPLPTSSPRSGPDRKARCCSGRCCSPDTDSFSACATRPIRASSPTLRSFSPAVQIFFLALVNFAAQSLRPSRRPAPRRRQRPQSAAAISRDGHPSAHALSGIRRIHRALRLRPRRAHHEVSRREMDSHHPPLDHGDLGIPHLRHLSRRALGLLGPRMGRLLGMGSRRKRLAHALARRARRSCIPS